MRIASLTFQRGDRVTVVQLLVARAVRPSLGETEVGQVSVGEREVASDVGGVLKRPRIKHRRYDR